MKCDQLKAYGMADPAIDDEYEMYKVTEVDEAIAELKARIDDLEKLNHDLCERVTENDDIRLHWEEIEQTRAENESLKAKLESVQASAYADSVDAGMRERRLKRALWLARTNNAINSYDKWNLFANFESEDKRFDIDENYETHGVTDFSALRTYAEWCKVWQNVARKCLKKAEEYK